MGEYLVLIYEDEKAYETASPETFDKVVQAHNDFAANAGAALKGGSALHPTATATTVRESDGSPLVTDGPFVETKEALGGVYLIEAPDLDAAIEIAKQVPAPYGGVEVRPVMTFE